MEKLIILAIFINSSFALQGQRLIIDDSIFQAGIYKNFEEFKYNNPSIEFDYEISTKNRGFGFLNTKRQLSFYKINMDKKKAKNIGQVFGFCDGKNVYINDSNPKLKLKTEFVKIEYFWKYCYYEDRVCTSNYTGNGITESCDLAEKVINIYTGEVISLSRKTLREILADDSELLTEFNNESQQNKKIKTYILKYIENQNDN
jgi:hypothetical protein